MRFTSSFEMVEEDTPMSAAGFPSPISDRVTKDHPGKRAKSHYQPERDFDSLSLLSAEKRDFDSLSRLSAEKARADYIQTRRSSEDRIPTSKTEPRNDEIVDQAELYQERYNPELPSFIEEIKSDDEVDNRADTKFVNLTAYSKNVDNLLDISNDRHVAIPVPKLQIKSLAGLAAEKAKEKSLNDKIAKKQLQIARVLKMKSSKSAEMSMEFPEDIKSTATMAAIAAQNAIVSTISKTLNDCDELFSPLYQSQPTFKKTIVTRNETLLNQKDESLKINNECEKIQLRQYLKEAKFMKKIKEANSSIQLHDPQIKHVLDILSSFYPGNELLVLTALMKINSSNDFTEFTKKNKTETWTSIHNCHLSSRLRSKGMGVWKLLYEKLQSEKLIESIGTKVVRHFGG
jgi:hypothetical protein